jgi:hypothetical protein
MKNQDTLDVIPNYLVAATPKELRLLMLKNNVAKAMFFKYFDIQYVATEKKWFAWYFDEADRDNLILKGKG